MASRLRSTGSALLAAALALGVSAGWARSRAGEPAERNKRIVAEAFDRWAAGGTTFFTDLLAPDVVWVIEGSGASAGTIRGRDALLDLVRPFAARLSQPLRPTMRRVWGDGDHVIVHWQGEAVARDGLSYRNRYAWILRMQDGKAVEVNAFLDLAAFDDVLRRIPEPARTGDAR